jgi:hypothetical protein
LRNVGVLRDAELRETGVLRDAELQETCEVSLFYVFFFLNLKCILKLCPDVVLIQKA